MKHLVKVEPYTGEDEIIIAGREPDIEVVVHYRPWLGDDEIVCKARIVIFRQPPVVIHVKQFPGGIWVSHPDENPELVKAFDDDLAYAPEVLATIVFHLFGLPRAITWARMYAGSRTWDIVACRWSADGTVEECQFVPASEEEIQRLFADSSHSRNTSPVSNGR